MNNIVLLIAFGLGTITNAIAGAYWTSKFMKMLHILVMAFFAYLFLQQIGAHI